VQLTKTTLPVRTASKCCWKCGDGCPIDAQPDKPYHGEAPCPQCGVKSRQASLPEKETRIYKLTAIPEHLNQIEKLLGWLRYCGNVGHSATAEVYIDGDGRARLDIDTDRELSEPTEEELDNSGDPEIRVVLA
jgi:hypothetical protein